MDDFSLHKQLAADTYWVADLALSQVLLMDDARFPWLILVPRRTGMRDWTDLMHIDQHRLLDEVGICAGALNRLYGFEKLNIGSLGNVVAQLHVHVIARFARDAAWPQPVWGAGERVAYTPNDAVAQLERLRIEIGRDT